MVWAGTYHAKPDPSRNGGIRGIIVPHDDLQSVIVIEPFTLKAYQAVLDSATGEFSLQGLPPGEYDLLIKTTGHVYEGITLETDPAQHAPDPPELKRLIDDVVTDYWKLEDYFNIKRIVRLTGNEEEVRFFVCQTRTKHTVDPGANKINANIRRFDLVEMRKTRETWQATTARHLLRQEVPHHSKDTRLRFHHTPGIGGFLIGDRMKNVGTLELEKLEPGDPDRYIGAAYQATQ